MLYQVVFKKYSEMAKNLVLVEEHIKADTFIVPDGNLVFKNEDGIALLAVPAGLWVGVEPVTDTNTSTLIVGGR